MWQSWMPPSTSASDIDVGSRSSHGMAAHEKLLTRSRGIIADNVPDREHLDSGIQDIEHDRQPSPWSPPRKKTVHDPPTPGIWIPMFMDSLLYGVPWYVDTPSFYRSDLLARPERTSPPGSWEEWFDCSAKMQSRFRGLRNFFRTNNEWGPR